MAFEPLPKNEDLLHVEQEEKHFLQQIDLHDMEDGKEILKDNSILEKEHVDIHEVVPNLCILLQ